MWPGNETMPHCTRVVITCSAVNNGVASIAPCHRYRHNGTITQGQLVPCAVNIPDVELSLIGGVITFSGSHGELWLCFPVVGTVEHTDTKFFRTNFTTAPKFCEETFTNIAAKPWNICERFWRHKWIIHESFIRENCIFRQLVFSLDSFSLYYKEACKGQWLPGGHSSSGRN